MNKVLFLRRGFGFTQDEIAKELKISRKLLRLKEKDEKEWTRIEMIKLTELFKEKDPTLTIDKIFFGN